MQAADASRTLPAPSDADQLTLIAPLGQLALPGAAAQLGLDGAAYAPPSDRSPERASQSLGPHTEFRTHAVSPPSARSPEAHFDPPGTGRVQLQLDLDAWKEAPQLTLWQRLDVVRDLVRGGDYDRDAKCNRVRFKTASDVELHRSERGSWSTAGTIKCNQWQTCPSCGPKKCRDVASKLSVAFDRHMATDAGHDVWMLSLTIPHYPDVRTEIVVDQLYAAFDTFAHSKEWRRFAKRWGVVGRVRVLDATHGAANGSHPHFHIALFADQSWIQTDHAFLLAGQDVETWTVDDDGAPLACGVRVMPSELQRDRERFGPLKPLRACSQDVRRKHLDEIKGPLVDAWVDAVRASGARIERLTEFVRKGVELTPSENAASYFTKWGLADEVGASASKTRNHLRLLDAVAAGVKGAAYQWKQWRRAVHQHPLVSGLSAIVRRLAVTDAMARDWLDEQRRRREAEMERDGTPIVKVPELRLTVRSYVYSAAMALGWPAVFAFVDDVASRSRGESPDWVQSELDGFLWRNMALARGSPDD